MFLLSSEVGNLFEQLTFWIAKLAYMLIGSMYKLFFSLANAQLFNNELISSFTNRIYYIIGVVMLFVFVYIILTNIINPDGGKGKNSPISVIKNVVIALAIIVFTPTMFELAYSVQSSVFENNVIGRLVLGGSSSDTETYDSANGFVSTLLSSSFSVDSDAPEGALIDLENAEFLLSYDGDFSGYEGLINSSNEYISYNGLISLIVACFCGYVLFGYLLDVALRAFKLGFLQVIAPVPAILSIIPNQTKILSSWIKETLKTFFEVFLKIAALMFIVFMIGQVNNNLSDIFGNNGFFYSAFVNIGLFSFLNILPKLLSQIFGFSEASGMFNLGSKLKNFTDGVSTYLKPVWAGAGAVSANVYSAAVASKTKRKHTFGEVLATTWTGATGGWKNGLKFGRVTEAQKVNEQLWSNQEYQSMNWAQRVGATFVNNVANDFGFKTHAEYELEIDDIAFREKDSEYEYNIRVSNEATTKLNQKVNSKYHNVESINKQISSTIKKQKEYITSEADKKTSKIKSSIEYPVFKSDGTIERYINVDYNNSEINELVRSFNDSTSDYYKFLPPDKRKEFLDKFDDAINKNYSKQMAKFHSENDSIYMNNNDYIKTLKKTHSDDIGRFKYVDDEGNEHNEQLYDNELTNYLNLLDSFDSSSIARAQPNSGAYKQLKVLSKSVNDAMEKLDSDKNKELASTVVTLKYVVNGKIREEKLLSGAVPDRIKEFKEEQKQEAETYKNKNIIYNDYASRRREVYNAQKNSSKSVDK